MSEQEKVQFYKKTWFIILTLIFFFPVGLYLMWVHTDWNRKAKWVITAIVALFAFSTLFGEDDTSNEIADSGNEQVASEESESEEAVPAEEEPEATEEEPIEVPVAAEEEPAEEDTSSNRDVIAIAEEQDYVIEASLIDGLYTASIDREVQNFEPADEEHYKIQMEHHGGLLGSKNPDRIAEVINNIKEENADYDYLVFEIIRTDNDEEVPERWLFARFNQEQAESLLSEEEVNDDVVESTADAFVEGGQADVGFEETVIGVNEEIHFSEFTLTVDDVEIIDGDAVINMMFRNDSFSDGLTFSQSLGMDVYQDDELLEETSGEYKDNLGSNRGVFYDHDQGIESPIDLSYGLVDEEKPLRIVLVPMLYEFEDNEEITIELN